MCFACSPEGQATVRADPVSYFFYFWAVACVDSLTSLKPRESHRCPATFVVEAIDPTSLERLGSPRSEQPPQSSNDYGGHH